MIEYHEHTGIGTPRINPKNLLGFPIFTATPTQKAEEGTFVLSNYGGFSGLWVMMNRVWNLSTLR